MNRIIIFLAFFLILNSCSSNKVENNFLNKKTTLIDSIEKMYERDQRYRFLIRKSPNKNKKDSLRKLQKMIDDENTLALIEITKKFGFPNTKRLEKPIPIWVVFHHASKKHFRIIKKVIKKENKAGRLYDNEYNMIMWHMGGRKGLPFSMEHSKIKIYKSTKKP